MRSFFRAKIHRATVTQADLNYEGSMSIDRDLMDAADIAEFEEVHIWNVTRGTRLTTYAIEAERGSGVICVNGAAAHLVHVGDLIIIATYHLVERAGGCTGANRGARRREEPRHRNGARGRWTQDRAEALISCG